MLSASTSGLQPDAISIHLWTSVKNWPYKHLATKFACLMDSWDSSCSYYHRKKVKVLVAQSCLILCDPMDWQEPARLFCPWNTPGNNTGVGIHSFLQGIFPTQRSNPGLPPSRQILYHLRDEQNIRIIYWGIIDLQCLLLLYSRFILFHILFHYGLSQDTEYPVLHSRTSLFTHSVYTSLHPLIPNSQSNALSPLSPWATTSLQRIIS